MKPEKLAAMATQIASYFRSYPHDEAAAGIRDHIVQFWTPGMRATLAAFIRDHGSVDPLVAAAVEAFPAAPSPARRASAGPDTLGELASDAG